MSDWKIGTALALGVLALGFATAEPVQAQQVQLHQFELLPMDSDGMQRLGQDVARVTGEPCGYAVAFDHSRSDIWIGYCDGDISRAFTLTPSGDITETGHIEDVLTHIVGYITSVSRVEGLIAIVSIAN
jgi:hypothetical protein